MSTVRNTFQRSPPSTSASFRRGGGSCNPLRKGLLARLALLPPNSSDGVVGNRQHIGLKEPLFLYMVLRWRVGPAVKLASDTRRSLVGWMNIELPIPRLVSWTRLKELTNLLPNPLKALIEGACFLVVKDAKVANIGCVHASQHIAPDRIVEFSITSILSRGKTNGGGVATGG